MDHLLLIVFLLVALIARGIARCLEQVIRLGRVRVMTERTSSSLDGGVDIGLVQSDLFPAVTGIADLISFLLKDELGDQSMPQVALLTFLLFDRKVDVFQAKGLIRKFLVTVQAISGGKPTFYVWGSGGPPPQLPLGCPFLGKHQNTSHTEKNSQKDESSIGVHRKHIISCPDVRMAGGRPPCRFMERKIPEGVGGFLIQLTFESQNQGPPH
jgi:hypothetical protein